MQPLLLCMHIHGIFTTHKARMLGRLAVLASLLYAGLVTYSISRKYSLYALYPWHPLAAVGFLVLTVKGITIAQAAYKQPGSHKATITKHGYWLVPATWLAVACSYVIYTNKNINGYPHLKSLHGKVGTATTLMMVLAQVFGGLLWYQPALMSKVLPLSKGYVQHGLAGTLCFLLMIATHGLALAGSYQGFAKGTPEWYGLAGLLGVVGLGVLVQAGRLVGRATRTAGQTKVKAN